MQLTKDFPAKEFHNASHRSLSQAEVEKARQFAENLLQPLRNLFGCIEITSFVRTGKSIGAGPHGTGDGVDFVPCDRSKAKMALMHLYASIFLRESFGVLILERDHIHATLPKVQGRTGVVLTEVGRNGDGRMDLRKGAFVPGPVLAAIGAAFLLTKLTD